jgi:hypothetical protein
MTVSRTRNPRLRTDPKIPWVPPTSHRHQARQSIDKDNSDDDKIPSLGATKPALLQALVAAAIRGKVGTRCGDGGTRMHLDNSIVAAAQFALGIEGCMPHSKARATLESLLGAMVVRRALAALRNDTNN